MSPAATPAAPAAANADGNRPRNEADGRYRDSRANRRENRHEYPDPATGRAAELSAFRFAISHFGLDFLLVGEQTLSRAFGNNHIDLADLVASIDTGLVGAFGGLAVRRTDRSAFPFLFQLRWVPRPWRLRIGKNLPLVGPSCGSCANTVCRCEPTSEVAPAGGMHARNRT